MEMCGSRRVDRLGSAASRETAFSSSSDRWADISDGVSEIESFACDERLMLPTFVPGTSHSSTSVYQQPAVERNERGESDGSLNANATEFVPTLSIPCPLMGICTVIAEGSEIATASAEDFTYYLSNCHFTSKPHSANPSNIVAKPPALSGQTRPRPYWKKKRPAPLSKIIVQQDRAPLTDARVEKRVQSINVGKLTKEYQWHMEHVQLHGIGAEPLTPNPFDESLSTRGWKIALEMWRKELKHGYEMHLAEHRLEGLSIASTEADEVYGSEADESTTADGEDTSSACSR